MNKVSQRIKGRVLPRLAALVVEYLVTFAAMLTISLIGAILVPIFDLVNIAILYLLPVFITAARWGRGPSFFAAGLGVLMFDYFFIPPAFAFKPDNPRDYFNLFVFLAVAVITGIVGTKLRNELERTRSREKRTLALYAASEKMAAENDLRTILVFSAEKISEAIQGEIIILMPDVDGLNICVEASWPPDYRLEDGDWPLIRSIFEHGNTIGKPGDGESGHMIFFPVKKEDRTMAVLAVRTGKDDAALSQGQVQFVETFANLAAEAITRINLAKEAQIAQWQAESKKRHLAAIVESSSDAIISVDLDGTIVSWNQGAEAIYGYPAEELLGRSISQLVLPQNKNRVPVILGKVKNGRRVNLYETTHVRKDGEIVSVSLNISPIRDASGEIVGMSAIARDITESKIREDQLRQSSERLRALSTRLQSIREEERTRLARDIHDELGQRLTGLMMDLVSLSQKPPKTKELLGQRIKPMESIIDDTIKLVRKISSELRPGILDDLGLVAAMEWQLNDFKKRTGIACEFSSELDDSSFDHDITTALFRVFQETLTNIIRHARATRVRIEINDQDGFITLTVEDNGKGISEAEIADPHSLGLLGIRERVVIFGGDVHISGARSRGTQVIVKIPHREETAYHAQDTGR
jgi:PAS domain S-box-containing protein